MKVFQSTEEFAGGVQGQVTTNIQVEGPDKPACVAASIVRYYR
jgi:hypothetical protein